MKIEKWQMRHIYTKAGKLGMVDRKKEIDELHKLVIRLTGKAHISKLDYWEAKAVYDNLEERCLKASNKPSPGMRSDAQVSKIWRLMYLIQEHDRNQSIVALDKRLKKFLKKYASVDDLKFLSRKKANDVIEGLKGVLEGLESKKQKIWELENKAGAIFEEMLNTADLGKWTDLKEEYDLIKRQIDVMQILRSDEIDQAAGANSKT